MIYGGEDPLSEEEQKSFNRLRCVDLQNDKKTETRIPSLDVIKSALAGLIPAGIARKVIDLLDDESNTAGGGSKIK